MKSKFKVKILWLAFFIILAFVLLTYFEKVIGVNVIHLNVNEVEVILQENKKTSILMYMILNLIRPIFIIIPAWIFAVVSGVIYGPLMGTFYSLIGIFLSATVSFYLARFLGRDFLVHFLGKKFHKMDEKLKDNGFKVLFIMRVTVVFPFDPLSFMAGISNINYKTYILATMLGVIPEILAFNYLGVGLKSILSLKLLIISSIIALIIICLVYLNKRIVR
ncbi:TVP38/TMEM64 family protein [Clostridium cylindrosporum]|uniref:TVP38/TMEM64 family membrane protein n=1 Tax=Clostridium cylindrosporum DSM 605 TaxID=1121307 RepID=A0A0J8D3T4_CLOCY|nr:TVP38/TMEM64 family protein [Clostridium cylindrosporum]KMT20830.1 hypothetical protein CLCY_1c00640 [Clostridium cylindrosporum DSM 605]